MTGADRVGVLGGTFDPIHEGHLAAARAAWTACGLTRLLLVPSGRPPHRTEQPRASGWHRFAMVSLAVAGEPGWEASDLELAREGPSYSFDTLTALHQQGLAPRQLYFVIGSDAFADLATWSRYPQVLDAAHFVVIARPGAPLDALDARVPAFRARLVPAESLAAQATPSIARLEVATPDVSSTEIRRRAADADAPLGGLVPPAVAAHIARHGLYSSPVPVAR